MCAVPQCVGYVCPLSLEELCLGLVASTVDLMVCVCFKLQSTKLMRSMINHLPFLLWAFLNLLHVGNKTDFCFLEMNTGRGKKRAVIKVTDPWKQIKQNMLYFPIQEKQIYLWWSNPKEGVVRLNVLYLRQHPSGKCIGEFQRPAFHNTLLHCLPSEEFLTLCAGVSQCFRVKQYWKHGTVCDFPSSLWVQEVKDPI